MNRMSLISLIPILALGVAATALAQPPEVDDPTSLLANTEVLRYRALNATIPGALGAQVPGNQRALEAFAGNHAAVIARWVRGADRCSGEPNGLAAYDFWTLDAGSQSRILVQQSRSKATVIVRGLAKRYRPRCDGDDLDHVSSGTGHLVVHYETSNHVTPRNFMALDLENDDWLAEFMVSPEAYCQVMEDQYLPFYRQVEQGAFPLSALSQTGGVAARSTQSSPSHFVTPFGSAMALVDSGVPASAANWFVHQIQQNFDWDGSQLGEPTSAAEQQAYAFRETMRDALATQLGNTSDITGAASLAQNVVGDFSKWAGRGLRNPAGFLASTLTNMLLDSPYSPLGRYQVAVTADLTSTFVTNLAFFGQNFHAGPVPASPPVVVSPLRDPRGESVQLPIDGDVLASMVLHTCEAARQAMEENEIPEMESSSGFFAGPGIYTPIHGGFSPTQSMDPTQTSVGAGAITPEMREQFNIPNIQIDIQQMIRDNVPAGAERDAAIDMATNARITGSLANYRTPNPPRSGVTVWGTLGVKYGAPVPPEDDGAEPQTPESEEDDDVEQPSPAQGSVMVVEIQPDPSRPGSAWLELYNAAEGDIDISGWSVLWGDGSQGLPAQLTIKPEERVVLPVDDIAFEADGLPAGTPLDWWPIRGATGGRTSITLYDARGRVVDEVPLSDGWPATEGGHTLELTGVHQANEQMGSWRRSSRPGGTPGRD